MAKNITDSTYRACVTGSYGTFVSNWVGSIEGPFNLLDIGANQGLFSLIAGVRPTCKSVISIEPNPFTFGLLAENIAANKLSAKVRPVCAALASSEVSFVKVSVPLNHSGAASMIQTDSGPAPELVFTAPTLSRELIEELRSQVRGGKWVSKIDVEGAELIVLNVLSDWGVLNSIDSIVIEISRSTGDDDHPEKIHKFLKEHGWIEIARHGRADHYDAIFQQEKSNLSE